MKAIVISHLKKSFGGKVAVDDLSLDVDKGEIMAFLGVNGSGKTTAFRCLLNILPQDQGKLLINDHKFSFKTSFEVGYLPEERGIYLDTKVLDFLVYIVRLRGIDKKEAKQLSSEYLQEVSLWEYRDKKISQLSSGMQQKVQIGVTIIHKPKVLILDEPFRGLDPLNRQLYTDIFSKLNKEYGATILYSTHVVDEAQRLADRVTIIKEGKRIAYGTMEEVRRTGGEKTIFIEFTKRLTEDSASKKLFTARITNKTAELAPQSGISYDQILKFLANENIGLLEFKVDLPSLNEAFIRLNQTDAK